MIIFSLTNYWTGLLFESCYEKNVFVFNGAFRLFKWLVSLFLSYWNWLLFILFYPDY